MPRILGRHELYPRPNTKPWLAGSGSSWGSSGSTSSYSSSTMSSSLRRTTSSVNLCSTSLQEQRHERPSGRQGMTYRIADFASEQQEPRAPPDEADNAWGYYVDFMEEYEERAAPVDTTMEEEILCLETSMMEWALKSSQKDSPRDSQVFGV